MTQWGLDTLFNPAKRHMDEEKRRLQSTREEVGDNSGGRRIDLESGKVVIRRAEDEQAQNERAQNEQAQDEQAQDGSKPPEPQRSAAQDAKAKPAPSAAAQRAAARRGRTAR